MNINDVGEAFTLKRQRDALVGQREDAPRHMYKIFGTYGPDDQIAGASENGVERNKALHATVKSALSAYFDGMIADIDEKLVALGVTISVEDRP